MITGAYPTYGLPNLTENPMKFKKKIVGGGGGGQIHQMRRTNRLTDKQIEEHSHTK